MASIIEVFETVPDEVLAWRAPADLTLTHNGAKVPAGSWVVEHSGGPTLVFTDTEFWQRYRYPVVPVTLTRVLEVSKEPPRPGPGYYGH